MKIFLSRLIVFALVLFGTGTSVWADDVRDSGIDVEASTIQIDFTPPSGIDSLLPDFSCFEENTSTIEKTLADIGLSADQLSRELLYSELNNSCFHHAGEYRVSLSIQDRAGNAVSSPEYSFTITASDVEPTAISYDVDPQNPVDADGQAPVTYTMTLRDFAGNPVTQLGSDDITLSTSDIAVDFGDDEDANRATMFEFGNGLTATDPTVNDAQFTIGFTSVVPTIARVGNLARFKNDVILDFETIGLKSITDAGEVGSDMDINPANDPAIAFRPLLMITPQAETEVIDEETVDKIYIDDWAEADPPDPERYEADPSHLYFELSENPDRFTDFRFEVVNVDTDHLHYEGEEALSSSITGLGFSAFQSAGLNSAQYEWRSSNGDGFDRRIGHNGEWNLSSDESYPLSLYVMGEYSLDSKTVRYPMGGSGFYGTAPNPRGGNDIDLTSRNNNVSGEGTLGYHTIWSGPRDETGADIIGRVLGTVDELKTSTSTFQVTGDIDDVDLRAVMLENAIRLIRGADDRCGNSLLDNNNTLASSDFSDCEVVVLDFSNEDDNFVKISGTLPEGSHTLIVVNGNVQITDNLVYGEDTDSFGVMVVNIPVEASFPETGNIFVALEVQQIQGNFFAEGGFMTNDTRNIAYSNPTNAVNQLYFEGTLFSNNTLGGATADTLQTPWGDVPSSKPEWASDLSSEALARIYDFHFVRSDNQSPVFSDNTNAFILAVVEPVETPPGFER